MDKIIAAFRPHIDAAPGGTAREMAARARQGMAPYLAQLPRACTVTADTALGLLAKLDN